MHRTCLEKFADSYICFRLELFHLVSYYFFLYRSRFSCLFMVFDVISSDIDEVLSMNPSANVFVLGECKVHFKVWLSYYGETDKPGELCYNSSISHNLTQMVNFLDFFLSSEANICSTITFPPLGDSVVVSISIHFPSNSKLEALFHRIAYDYSCAYWDDLLDHLRNVSWEDILKFSASATDRVFCKWNRLKLMYISLIVNIRSSLTHIHGFPLFVLLP